MQLILLSIKRKATESTFTIHACTSTVKIKFEKALINNDDDPVKQGARPQEFL